MKNKTKGFFILLVTLGVFSTPAQNSFEKRISETREDSEKVNIFCKVSDNMRNGGKYDSSLLLAKKAVSLAGEIKSGQKYNAETRIRIFIKALRALAAINITKTNLPEGLKAQLEVLHTLDSLPSSGISYKWIQTEYTKIYCNLAVTYINMAASNKNTADVKASEKYIHKALSGISDLPAAILEKDGDPYNIYINTGAIFHHKYKITKQAGFLDSALFYYYRSYEMIRKLKKRAIQKEGLRLSDISHIYLEKYSLNNDTSYITLSLENARQSFELRKEVKYKYGMAESLLAISECYVARKDYKNALKQMQTGLPVAEEIHNIALLKDYYRLLSEIQAQLKNYTEAYNNHLLFSKYNDSVLNTESTKQIAEMSTKYESEKKDNEIKLLNKDRALDQKEIERQAMQRNAFIVGFVLVLLLAVFIFRSYKQKQKANETIQLQKKIVEEKNKDITDSINYAKRIQDAVLPAKELKKKLFPESFILFMPRDIVSGDFYWYSEKNGKRIIAAADCTGHGVPGAFMSLIGNTFLNEIVNAGGITSPSQILDQLRERIIHSLKQSGGNNKDGMDICVLSFHNDDSYVEFAGANNPLWLIRSGSCTEYPASKQPVGYNTGHEISFSEIKINLEKGDTLYIFSDGYADQFGGPKGKKFKYKQLQEKLIEISLLPMQEQENIMKDVYLEWKGDLEQLDDVLLIGIRVT